MIIPLLGVISASSGLVNKMSREQAQQFLVKMYEQMMMRETMYKQFLKHEWGIGPSPQL